MTRIRFAKTRIKTDFLYLILSGWAKSKPTQSKSLILNADDADSLCENTDLNGFFILNLVRLSGVEAHAKQIAHIERGWRGFALRKHGFKTDFLYSILSGWAKSKPTQSKSPILNADDADSLCENTDLKRIFYNNIKLNLCQAERPEASGEAYAFFVISTKEKSSQETPQTISLTKNENKKERKNLKKINFIPKYLKCNYKKAITLTTYT